MNLRSRDNNNNSSKVVSKPATAMVPPSSTPNTRQKRSLGTPIAIPTSDDQGNNDKRRQGNYNNKRQRKQHDNDKPVATKSSLRLQQKKRAATLAPGENPKCIDNKPNKPSTKSKQNRPSNDKNHSKTSSKQDTVTKVTRRSSARNGKTKKTAPLTAPQLDLPSQTSTVVPTQQQPSEQQPPEQQPSEQQPSEQQPSEQQPTQQQPAQQQKKAAKRKGDSDKTQSNTKKTKIELPKLVLPKKHIIREMRPAPSLPEMQAPAALLKGHILCPYCHTDLDLKKSRILTKALDDIQRQEKTYLEKQSRKRKDKPASKKATRRRPNSTKTRLSFCHLHRLELEIKPIGEKEGWPTTIDFDRLKQRIPHFKPDLDSIIANELESSYRLKALAAYKEMGKNKARSTMGVMSRFDLVMPGYYGAKGASVIQKQLSDMYLLSGILTTINTAPQTPMEYLQHVLTPEVGFRLIREDLIKNGTLKKKDPDLDQQILLWICVL
ncbi:hypothetical protein [Absidia glauca]|uniref:Restriction of telomere capping protein 4 n=1 Tax=Absidia glauca TaxID=4829 RepID=A0A168LCY2_ABSGL|nr:hypothetical protein [Absidia glauca]